MCEGSRRNVKAYMVRRLVNVLSWSRTPVRLLSLRFLRQHRENTRRCRKDSHE